MCMAGSNGATDMDCYNIKYTTIFIYIRHGCCHNAKYIQFLTNRIKKNKMADQLKQIHEVRPGDIRTDIGTYFNH